MGENDEEEESSTDETDKIIELDEYPSKKLLKIFMDQKRWK